MFSLFDLPVVVGGTVSGLAYVVIRFYAEDMLAGLRWLWNGIKEFLFAVSPLLTLLLICWLIRHQPWAATAYKAMGYAAVIVMVIAYVIVYGANQDEK